MLFSLIYCIFLVKLLKFQKMSDWKKLSSIARKWKFCRIYRQWIRIEQTFLYTVVYRTFLYNPTNLKVPKKAPCGSFCEPGGTILTLSPQSSVDWWFLGGRWQTTRIEIAQSLTSEVPRSWSLSPATSHRHTIVGCVAAKTWTNTHLLFLITA